LKLLFFQVFELNQTENRFEPTMFGLVFCLPKQLKPVCFISIFTTLCLFSEKSWLSQQTKPVRIISRIPTSIFFLLDPCPKIKFCPKNTQKKKERKKVIWLEEKKIKDKDINYSNVKPEREETNYKFLHGSTSSIEYVVFLYSFFSINNQTWCPIVILTRPTSRKAQKSPLLVWHNNLLQLHGYEKLYNNYIVMREIERKRIKRLKAKVKVKRGVPEELKVKKGVPLKGEQRSMEQQEPNNS